MNLHELKVEYSAEPNFNFMNLSTVGMQILFTLYFLNQLKLLEVKIDNHIKNQDAYV